MSYDQATILAILALALAGFVWGRLRYDIVAVGVLLLAVVLGVVPAAAAFSGFGHPATITVAAVLILSRALSNSGAVDAIARRLAPATRSPVQHVGTLTGLGALLSTVMNNIGALSLLLPVAVQSAQKVRRSPAIVLMPLSFGSILGGLVTLIGTPPNIIVAGFRGTVVGEPFTMFDFTPVGAVVAAIGVAFVTLVGWRLIPKRRLADRPTRDLFKIEDFVAEGRVTDTSSACGKTIGEIDELGDQHEVVLIGLLRDQLRIFVSARHQVIQPGDLLIAEGGGSEIANFMRELDLELTTTDDDIRRMLRGPDYVLSEAVVAPRSPVVGQSPLALRLTGRYGINLLAISRRGERLRERLGAVRLKVGDIILLQGDSERLGQVIPSLGCLPLGERKMPDSSATKASLAIGLFAAALILAATGLLPFEIALAGAALVAVVANLVPVREMYDAIDWPVVILLGAMIPVGIAIETTGTGSMIASTITVLSAGMSPLVALAILMVVTMIMTDIMNNAATALVAAPIAFGMGQQLNVNPDAFLMAVAIGASSAFLTPIGHQNNALILGPGGYRFGDYWRMGLPLKILILVVSVPLLAVVWPLS
jgi:di/tricarboxylate transporter